MTAPFWTRERLDLLVAVINAGGSFAVAGERVGTTGAAAKFASQKYLRREGARYVIEREAAPRVYRPRAPKEKAAQGKRAKRRYAKQTSNARLVAFTSKPIYAPPPRPVLTGSPEQEPRGCRFIFGELSQPGWRYCQQPTSMGSSWCCQCSARVFTAAGPHRVVPVSVAREGRAA